MAVQRLRLKTRISPEESTTSTLEGYSTRSTTCSDHDNERAESGYDDESMRQNKAVPVTRSSMQSPQHVFLSNPEGASIQGLVVPYMVSPQLPNISLISSEMVLNMTPDAILWAVSRCIPASIFDIPPIQHEDRDSWRALILKNVPRQATQSDVLRHFKPSDLEAISYVNERNADRFSLHGQMIRSRFELKFLDFYSALKFYAECMLNPIEFDGVVVEVIWMRVPPIKKDIMTAIKTLHATRTLSVQQKNQLRKAYVRSDLWECFRKFGIIERLEPCEMTPESPIKWRIQFANIESAVHAKLSFDARDGHFSQYCFNSVDFSQSYEAPLHLLKKQAALLYLGESPYNWKLINHYNPRVVTKALSHQLLAAAMIGALRGDSTNIGNRCICLSKLPQGTKMQDVCNTVRGGMIECVKMLPERSVCFVTFLEPTAAAQFWVTYQSRRLNVNSERVRVGWGRHSGSLAPEILEVVKKGATRNLCIYSGSKQHREPSLKEDRTDHLAFNKDHLYRLFSPFGEIEQVRVTAEVGCSFVSFADISSAVQAADWARETNQFPGYKVNYGKDRCAATSRPQLHDQQLQRDHQPRFAGSDGSRSALINFLRRELPALSSAQSGIHNVQVPLVPIPVMDLTYPGSTAPVTMSTAFSAPMDPPCDACEALEKPITDGDFGGPLPRKEEL